MKKLMLTLLVAIFAAPSFVAAQGSDTNAPATGTATSAPADNGGKMTHKQKRAERKAKKAEKKAKKADKKAMKAEKKAEDMGAPAPATTNPK